jgi:A/G-specific adenine glycosylase
MMNQEALLSWYRRVQRPLPWRLNPSPWSILLSEILLQQTQMERGIVYHQKLLKRFPTIQSMAESNVDDVLLLWQGAGYYSRARRLHALSVEVMEQYSGTLPTTYDELLKLPGVGPYTAAAVSSIAFSQPVACVDGNIRRVMARQTNQENPTVKDLQTFADEQLVVEFPGDWNQAMMELGALVCRPKKPICDGCPIHDSCLGIERAHELPLPRRLVKKEVSMECVVCLDDQGRPELIQRPDSGLFAGLWGPMYDTKLDTEEFDFLGTIQHQLSHRTLIVKVWKGSSSKGINPNEVALSTLDRRVLNLAGVVLDVP